MDKIREHSFYPEFWERSLASSIEHSEKIKKFTRKEELKEKPVSDMTYVEFKEWLDLFPTHKDTPIAVDIMIKDACKDVESRKSITKAKTQKKQERRWQKLSKQLPFNLDLIQMLRQQY